LAFCGIIPGASARSILQRRSVSSGSSWYQRFVRGYSVSQIVCSIAWLPWGIEYEGNTEHKEIKGKKGKPKTRKSTQSKTEPTDAGFIGPGILTPGYIQPGIARRASKRWESNGKVQWDRGILNL
jgi:hypothetical protein